VYSFAVSRKEARTVGLRGNNETFSFAASILIRLFAIPGVIVYMGLKFVGTM
jgi:hypothetical protein